jgi:hypothetical protein
LIVNSRANSASVRLADYAREIEPTDKLPANDLKPVLLGLFGEVGGIMATAKKHHREPKAFVGYHKAVVEEFGDTLWYFATLCRRLGLSWILFSLPSQMVRDIRRSLSPATCPTALSPLSPLLRLPSLWMIHS